MNISYVLCLWLYFFYATIIYVVTTKIRQERHMIRNIDSKVNINWRKTRYVSDYDNQTDLSFSYPIKAKDGSSMFCKSKTVHMYQLFFLLLDDDWVRQNGAQFRQPPLQAIQPSPMKIPPSSTVEPLEGIFSIRISSFIDFQGDSRDWYFAYFNLIDWFPNTDAVTE